MKEGYPFFPYLDVIVELLDDECFLRLIRRDDAELFSLNRARPEEIQRSMNDDFQFFDIDNRVCLA